MPIIKNQINGSVTIQTSANGTFKIAGNNSVSNVTASNTEVISNGRITGIFWGVSGTNTWTVKRGANTVAVLTNSGFISGIQNIALDTDSPADLVLELSGGTGAITIEVKKQSDTFKSGY